MSKITALSLFSGGGMIDLAAERVGIETAYLSEVEPFAIAVTNMHFPKAKQLGDVTAIDGGKIKPCDIVMFGSPCQSWSIAGKRESWNGKSGLFTEAIRIMREMLEATNGDYPRYFLFENVPNLVSIDKSSAFKIVMDSFSDLGFICDPNLLDSQNFGVAQRRLRLFVVGINRRHYNPECFADDYTHLRHKRLTKPLLLWGGETFSGIATRPHTEERQHLSEILERDADKKYNLSGLACSGILRRVDARGKKIPKLLRDALEAQAYGIIAEGTTSDPVAFHAGELQRLDGGHWSNVVPTLRAESHSGDNGAAVAYENHSSASRYKEITDGVFPVIPARFGTGGNSQHLIAEPVGAFIDGQGADAGSILPKAYGICSRQSNSMLSDNPYSGVYEAETAKTLDTSSQRADKNQGGLAIVCMEGNGQRPSHKGVGASEDGIAYTLNTIERLTVCYQDSDKPVVMGCGSFGSASVDICHTLEARQYKDPPVVGSPDLVTAPTAQRYVVRRLTERECLALMGLPRDWCDGLGNDNPTDEDIAFWSDVFETHRKILGKNTKPRTKNQIVKWLRDPYSAAACYKLAGNGAVVNVCEWLLQGVADYAAGHFIQ